MYVYMYVCIYVTCVYIHMCVYVYECVCVYIYMPCFGGENELVL